MDTRTDGDPNHLLIRMLTLLLRKTTLFDLRIVGRPVLYMPTFGWRNRSHTIGVFYAFRRLPRLILTRVLTRSDFDI